MLSKILPFLVHKQMCFVNNMNRLFFPSLSLLSMPSSQLDIVSSDRSANRQSTLKELMNGIFLMAVQKSRVREIAQIQKLTNVNNNLFM